MSMRITGLFAENFKRLVAVNITPAGNVVQITGKNANGKSSCLDAIEVALEGLDACPDEPIRKGEKKALIRVKLSGDRELLVTREFARKEEGGFTSKLIVASPDGAQYSKAQTTLNELLGELGFDPLEFVHMKDDGQFNALRSFVPGVDFALIDSQNKGDYDRRTTVNRQAREAEAAANQITVPAETPDEPINIAELGTELEAANVLNADVERRSANRVRAAEDVGTWRGRATETMAKLQPKIEQITSEHQARVRSFEQQISALQRQLDAEVTSHAQALRTAETELRTEADGFTKQADELQAKLDGAEKLPALIDTAPIKAKLATAQAVNLDVERKRQKAQHLATAKKYEDESKVITEAMDARTATKDAAIAAAKMPVPGLGFALDAKGNGYVTLNGVPFSQASSAEKLRTSCAIAMAKNPKLRVCFIRDGSLLDEDGLRLIDQMAQENDFQVFLEKVDSSGNVGFVIENGMLASSQSARSAA